ncbi:unannotated protein [freshwater metagenome]|uniref:Unannotated protein n=1 Tax=freshwater metagenome TaxID=449393 RepID=A0A6J6NG46_9ZZZZ
MDVGAESTADVFEGLDAYLALLSEFELRPRQLGNVVAIDNHAHMGGLQQVLSHGHGVAEHATWNRNRLAL